MTLLTKVKTKSRHLAFPKVFRATPRDDLVRIGSVYGGWWVPETLLGPESICYLAGAGEDITFDLGLMERFGCRVVSVDPTPRAIKYVSEHAPAEGYRFLPVGLGGSDRVERFYTPADPAHVSHSIANLQRTQEFFEAQLRTPRSLMDELGHDRIDLLKMDVEGAEYEILDFLMRQELYPRVVCTEFDQPAPISRTLRYVERLRQCGYAVAKVDGFNVTFVRE